MATPSATSSSRPSSPSRACLTLPIPEPGQAGTGHLLCLAGARGGLARLRRRSARALLRRRPDFAAVRRMGQRALHELRGLERSHGLHLAMSTHLVESIILGPPSHGDCTAPWACSWADGCSACSCSASAPPGPRRPRVAVSPSRRGHPGQRPAGHPGGVSGGAHPAAAARPSWLAGCTRSAMRLASEPPVTGLVTHGRSLLKRLPAVARNPT